MHFETVELNKREDLLERGINVAQVLQRRFRRRVSLVAQGSDHAIGVGVGESEGVADAVGFVSEGFEGRLPDGLEAGEVGISLNGEVGVEGNGGVGERHEQRSRGGGGEGFGGEAGEGAEEC